MDKEDYEDGWEEGEKAFEQLLLQIDSIYYSYSDSKVRGFKDALKNSFDVWY